MKDHVVTTKHLKVQHLRHATCACGWGCWVPDGPNAESRLAGEIEWHLPLGGVDVKPGS